MRLAERVQAKMNLNQYKRGDQLSYKKCRRKQFVFEHLEQHYTGLNLVNNGDFTVLNRSLHCEIIL